MMHPHSLLSHHWTDTISRRWENQSPCAPNISRLLFLQRENESPSITISQRRARLSHPPSVALWSEMGVSFTPVLAAESLLLWTRRWRGACLSGVLSPGLCTEPKHIWKQHDSSLLAVAAAPFALRAPLFPRGLYSCGLSKFHSPTTQREHKRLLPIRCPNQSSPQLLSVSRAGEGCPAWRGSRK